MLSNLEDKIAAVVREGLAGRDHARVVRAPVAAADVAAGKGVAHVVIDGLTPRPVFEREQTDVFHPSGTISRRVLPVEFTGGIAFQFRPAQATDAGLPAARDTLLEDVSRVLHHLAGGPSQKSDAFHMAAPPDPEFGVTLFELIGATTKPELAGGVMAAEVRFRGEARLWRSDQPQQEDPIRAVQPMVTTFPVSVLVERPVIAPGESTRIRIRAAGNVRGADGALLTPDTRIPLTLALCLPTEPAVPGELAGGEAGVDPGVHIVPVAEPETVVEYRAPRQDAPAPPGGAQPRVVVEIRLATPDRRAGALLGSAVVRVESRRDG